MGISHIISRSKMAKLMMNMFEPLRSDLELPSSFGISPAVRAIGISMAPSEMDSFPRNIMSGNNAPYWRSTHVYQYYRWGGSALMPHTLVLHPLEHDAERDKDASATDARTAMHRNRTVLAELFLCFVNLANEVDKTFARLWYALFRPVNELELAHRAGRAVARIRHLELSQFVLRHVVLGDRIHHVALIAHRTLGRLAVTNRVESAFTFDSFLNSISIPLLDVIVQAAGGHLRTAADDRLQQRIVDEDVLILRLYHVVALRSQTRHVPVDVDRFLVLHALEHGIDHDVATGAAHSGRTVHDDRARFRRRERLGAAQELQERCRMVRYAIWNVRIEYVASSCVSVIVTVMAPYTSVPRAGQYMSHLMRDRSSSLVIMTIVDDFSSQHMRQKSPNVSCSGPCVATRSTWLASSAIEIGGWLIMPGVWKLIRRMSTGSVGAGPAPKSAAISGRVTAAWSGALHGCRRRRTKYTTRKQTDSTSAAMIGPTTQSMPGSSFLPRMIISVSCGTLGLGRCGGSPVGASFMSSARNSENGLDVYRCFWGVSTTARTKMRYRFPRSSFLLVKL
uniref:Uncharacterized protein n=1 Tax=Anopheles coluzzii TaxID=1518534 RepID=A0A8W7NYZ1_ANOCL